MSLTASIEIIHESDTMLAINKQAGMLSIPDREGKETSLKAILHQRYENIFTVHRLDRETSGAIVFAKDEETHRFLSTMFEERTVEKYYLGLVLGTPSVRKDTIDAPIAENMSRRGYMLVHKRGKASITDYEVLEEFGKYSLLQFRIHTGRTHQIRVHMNHIGHPILGDTLYGDGKPLFISALKKNYNLARNELDEKPILNRLALHSSSLKFNDPQGKRIEIEALPPKDLRAALNQLRKLSK